MIFCIVCERRKDEADVYTACTFYDRHTGRRGGSCGATACADCRAKLTRDGYAISGNGTEVAVRIGVRHTPPETLPAAILEAVKE